jgi:hypothetical protein
LTSGSQIAIFDLPDKAEQMQRRAYARVPVPKNLAIMSCSGCSYRRFRGAHDSYWQGKLMDLRLRRKSASRRTKSPTASARSSMQFTPIILPA